MAFRPKSSLWIKVHLIFPFVPFTIESFFKIVLNNGNLIDAFNATSFTLTVALICLFINQNLLTIELPASNELELSDLKSNAVSFKIYSLVAFSFFVGLVLLGQLIDHPTKDVKYAYLLTKLSVFIFSLLPLISAIKVQKSFNLKASL